MNTNTKVLTYLGATVHYHPTDANAFLVVIPATSGIWANRESGELRDDLAAAGIQFPISLTVKMDGNEPVSIDGPALTWSAERAGDASTPVPADCFTQMALVDDVYDACQIAFSFVFDAYQAGAAK